MNTTSNRVSPIMEAIRSSYGILDLEDDWDDEGAKKACPEAFNKAMLFTHLLISKVGFDLSVPDIDLGRDGSIFVNFKNSTHEFLAIVKKDTISCYGDDGNKGDVIQSSDITTEDVVNWCKKFMAVKKETDSK